MNSAYDTIFDLYQDEDTLAEALKSARAKVSELKENLRKSELKTESLNVRIETAADALRDLDTIFSQETRNVASDWDGANGQARAADSLAATIVKITGSAKRSQIYVYYQDMIEMPKVKIEKAKGYVKMLEGAKIVADAGGMKRAKDEEDEFYSRE